MDVRKHALTLAIAFMLALAIMSALSVPVGVVHAAPVQGEGTVYCYYDGKQYSVGAKITLQDGTVQTCQKDGTWARPAPPSVRLPVAPIGPAAPATGTTPSGPVAPHPIGNAP